MESSPVRSLKIQTSTFYNLLQRTTFEFFFFPPNRTSTDAAEFDFETDRYDIKIPSDVSDTFNGKGTQSTLPECFYKLRVRSTILCPGQIFLLSLKRIKASNFLSLYEGILQHSLPEAPDADYHPWSKSENSAHC